MGVQLLTHTPAKKILTGAQGEVTRVLVKTRGGEEFTISTRSVIIATGGSLRKIAPLFFLSYSLQTYRDKCLNEPVVHVEILCDALFWFPKIGSVFDGIRITFFM